MLALTFTITGVADVVDALDRASAPGLAQEIAKRVASDVVLPKLAQYPAPSGRKQMFVSDKSRRYFFAALRRGQIVVPYHRTGDLGNPDNWAEMPTGDGLTLRSTAQHSDLVRTKAKQAKYHKGTWPTTEDIARESELDAGLVATAVLVEIIGGAGP